MALNAKKAGGGERKFVEQPLLEAGNYPARLVQIIDFGLQAQRPFQGKDKAPIQEIGLTYELLDAFMVDEGGKELEDKPRWMSEQMAFHGLFAERAKSTQRYHAFDPQEVQEGNWPAFLEAPCMVTVVHNPNPKNPERPYENIGNVTPMRPRDAANAPELKNKAAYFDLDEPDAEMFAKFPQWIREKIQGNLNYKGSKLEALVGAAPKKDEAKPKNEAKAPKEVDQNDPPFDGGVDVGEDNPY